MYLVISVSTLPYCSATNSKAFGKQVNIERQLSNQIAAALSPKMTRSIFIWSFVTHNVRIKVEEVL